MTRVFLLSRYPISWFDDGASLWREKIILRSAEKLVKYIKFLMCCASSRSPCRSGNAHMVLGRWDMAETGQYNK